MALETNRRSYLKAAVAGTVAGLAGCGELRDGLGLLSSNDQEDQTRYTDWLTARESAGESEAGFGAGADIAFRYVDIAAFRAGVDDGTATPSPDPGGTDTSGWTPGGPRPDHPYYDDPLYRTPMRAQNAQIDARGMLRSYGLTGLLGYDDETSFRSTIDEYLVDYEKVVLIGDVDTDEIDGFSEPSEVRDRLIRSGYSPDQADEIIAERYDGLSEPETYPTDPDDEDLSTSLYANEDYAAAVGEKAIVLAMTTVDDPAGVVRNAVDAKNGDAERAHETYDEFGRLIQDAGSGHLTVGLYGDTSPVFDTGSTATPTDDSTATPTDDPTATPTDDSTATPGGSDGVPANALAGARATVASATLVDADGTPSVEDARTYESELAALDGDYDEDDVRDLLGHSATQATVEFDGDRVDATGTWEDLALVEWLAYSTFPVD